MWKLQDWKNENFAYQNEAFTNEEIDLIFNLSSLDGLILGKVADNSLKQDVRNNKVKWLDENNTNYEFIYRKLVDSVSILNQFFEYDLQYLERIQLSEYNIGEYYKIHKDSSYDKQVSRKLTLVVQLTDPSEYEGGELCIYGDDYYEPMIAPKQKGTLIAFPSHLFHEVKPVTRGTRHTMVCWVCGNRFK